MSTLNFSTGVVKHSINEKYEVEFNPTDVFFGERLIHAFEELEKKQGDKQDALAKATPREALALARKWDGEMREVIDSVFGGPLCENVFGDTCVYALADGLPLWANLLFAVMDEMDVAMVRERKATDPRISKYTKKYHK